MESSSSPFSEPANLKEDLIKTHETKQLIYQQQNINANQYFVKKENKSLENKNKFIFTFPLSSFIWYIFNSIIPAFIIKDLSIIYRLCIIISGIIFLLIILLLSNNKI